MAIAHVGHGLEHIVENRFGEGEDGVGLEALGVNLVRLVRHRAADLQDHVFRRLAAVDPEADGEGRDGRGEAVGAEVAGVIDDEVDGAQAENLAEKGVHVGLGGARDEGQLHGPFAVLEVDFALLALAGRGGSAGGVGGDLGDFPGIEVEDVAAAQGGEVFFHDVLDGARDDADGFVGVLGGAGVDAVVDGHLAADEQHLLVLGVDDDAVDCRGERPQSFRCALSESELPSTWMMRCGWVKAIWLTMLSTVAPSAGVTTGFVISQRPSVFCKMNVP